MSEGETTSQAASGNKVFVADAGAMQFERLGDWTIKPGEGGSIRFFDRNEEADADRVRPVWDTILDTLKLYGTSRNRLNIDGSHRPAKLSLNWRACSWERRAGSWGGTRPRPAALGSEWDEGNPPRPPHPGKPPPGGRGENSAGHHDGLARFRVFQHQRVRAVDLLNRLRGER